MSNSRAKGLTLQTPSLNPTCHLLALLGAHHIFHISGLRVKQFEIRLRFEDHILRWMLFCAALYFHLWPVWLCHISPHYLINDTIFGGKELLNINCILQVPMTVHREQNMKREDQQDATIRCFISLYCFLSVQYLNYISVFQLIALN